MVHFLPNYPPQLWPPAASATAGEVDEIFAVWCAVLILLVAPVFVFMTWCAVKYRAGRKVDRSHREARNLPVEMTWTIIPFLISLVFFFWAGSVYLRERESATERYANNRAGSALDVEIPAAYRPMGDQ